jgi:hypothetical protein
MAEEPALTASAIREIQKLTLATMRVHFEKRPGDPDHSSQAFRLTPFPGELSGAMDRTMMALREMLEGQKLTPFHGNA